MALTQEQYDKQFKELQEYIFDLLREYPLDKSAVNVLSELVSSKKKDRIEFFERTKGQDVAKVFFDLEDSGTIERYLEVCGFLEYINE